MVEPWGCESGGQGGWRTSVHGSRDGDGKRVKLVAYQNGKATGAGGVVRRMTKK